MNILNKSTACITATLILFGCGKPSADSNPTQVVAKVNGNEISVHQINQVLKNSPSMNMQNMSLARKEILEKLIDQQIAIERAESDQLDRNPDVVMAIDSAKRQIIANAYVSELISGSVKVNQADIQKYYDENPALFSHRKIYSFEDMEIENKENINLTGTEEIMKFKGPEEFTEWLKSKNYNFSGGYFVRPAEQIPLEILAKLNTLNPGDAIVLNSQNNLHAIFISSVQEASVTLADAQAAIKTYLSNTTARALVTNKIKDLRNKSKIEYMGEFNPSNNQDPQSIINKGLTGLK
jgi:EpsD family peptidyl-prolyl cis-trans isomerase